MYELKFSGNTYGEVKAAIQDWLHGEQQAAQALTALAREPQPPVNPTPAPAAMPVTGMPQNAPWPTATPAPAPIPMPPAGQMAPAPTQTPAAPIPTTAPSYTQADLMTAGARLMTVVGMPAMQQLLGRFGVAAIHQLPQERYGEFAQALREMGGTI